MVMREHFPAGIVLLGLVYICAVGSETDIKSWGGLDVRPGCVGVGGCSSSRLSDAFGMQTLRQPVAAAGMVLHGLPGMLPARLHCQYWQTMQSCYHYINDVMDVDDDY